jgi:hypothetical protein
VQAGCCVIVQVGAASRHMGLRKRCCRRAREDVKRRDLWPAARLCWRSGCLRQNAGCIAPTTENACSVMHDLHYCVSPSGDDCDREPPPRDRGGASAWPRCLGGSNHNETYGLIPSAASPAMPSMGHAHPHRVCKDNGGPLSRSSRVCDDPLVLAKGIAPSGGYFCVNRAEQRPSGLQLLVIGRFVKK